MNIIDTRDLYKQQCELQSELETLQDAVSEAQEALDELLTTYRAAVDAGYPTTATGDALNEATAELEDWQSEYQEELDELNALESEVGDEWMHGETLIDEDDFEEYAQELAEDISGMPRNQPWPFNCIDWEQAANELRMDYSSCEYQGNTYLFRS